MKRLARILFNAATVASLVLCVATVVFWVRGRNGVDRAQCVRVRHEGPFDVEDYHFVRSDRGAVSVGVFTSYITPDPARGPETGWEYEFQSAPRGWRRRPGMFLHDADFHAGFWGASFSRYTRGASLPLRPSVLPYRVVYGWRIFLPHWMLAAVTGAPPTLAAARLGMRLHRRRQSQRQGRCHKCNYDLRATPGRCPECGTVPGKRATIPA